MTAECVICKREMVEEEEGSFSWDNGGKLGYLCKACKQRVVEGAKAWLNENEWARATGERESDDSKDK